MTEPEFCQVVVTFDERSAAEEVARTIVEERLAACAQLDGPIVSTYWWNGRVEEASEWRVEFKTRTARLEALGGCVAELHAYDVPQVVATPIVGGLPAYLNWIADETTAPAG